MASSGGDAGFSPGNPAPMELALSLEDPRVARSSQPWAGGRNAVGVGVGILEVDVEGSGDCGDLYDKCVGFFSVGGSLRWEEWEG